jgi:hypothetical protein
MKRRLSAALIAAAMLVGLGGGPAQAVADPAGPACQWWLPSGCAAANWYTDIRGLGMEQSADRLRRGVVSSFGPYLTTSNRGNVETWIAAYGSRASFRLCVRNEAVVFASRVAMKNQLINQWSQIFKLAKGFTGAGTVSKIWTYAVKPLAMSASNVTLTSQARLSVEIIGGCS